MKLREVFVNKTKTFEKFLEIRFVLYLLAALTIFAVSAGTLARETVAAAESKRWTDKFDLSACTWSSTGKNDFFILEPGYQQILEGNEDQSSTRLVITVLPETRKIGDIETRVVEEKESENGQVIEISRNFFAVCQPMNDVFYFGEEVDIYKDGKLDNHEGAWVHGKDGARAGLFIPARTLLGARYYQEIAPKVALDRVEVISDSDTLKTPLGSYQDCLKTEETTPLEPGIKEYKVYAKGIGIIQDGDLLLTKYGTVSSK